MTSPTADRVDPLPLRTALAVRVVAAVNRASQLSGRGAGTVLGGRAGMAVDPRLLERLLAGRRVALVSGTNGKTTTTRLLASALGAGGGAVATSESGANMPAGHVAALVEHRHASVAVLEVDESYLGQLIEAARPVVVVLLNLSRDQLDRIAEVRLLVDRWRAALGRCTEGTVVVANADDPMVAWSAATAPDVRWVGAGQVWREDAVGCPACGARIVFEADGEWHCDSCPFRRPLRCAWLDGDDLVLADGTRHPVVIRLPGAFNRANAVMVAMAAPLVLGTDGGDPGIDVETTLRRLAAVEDVAGRFTTVVRSGRPVRLLLAKNPAGWTAIFDLLDETGDRASPVVLSVNARTADGLDTSWLWDVPFERLAGRQVYAAGERCRDLAVRLRYAEVRHDTIADPIAAVDRAVAAPSPPAGPEAAPVEFLGNYTAFAELRRRL